MAIFADVTGIELSKDPNPETPSDSPFGMGTVGSLSFQGQRFPESCQRTSLQDEDGEDLDIDMDCDDDDRDYDDSYPEPTMGRRYLQLRSDPSRSPRATEGDFGRRTPEWSSSSWEPPALTDSDSSSIASSVGPPSPQLQPSWPRWEPHPKRTEEPVCRDSRGKTSVLSEPEHGSPPSSLPPSRSDHQRQEEFQDHTCFSKVVVTKFNNPPRYKLKKVKFHQCPICLKSFPRPSGLRTHMNMHTKTKPHLCPYEGCDKSFSVISNAKRHYRTHLVDLPPEQTLPSEPYNVDFSDPVVVSSDPPPFYSSPSESIPSSSSSSSSSSELSESSPSPSPDSSGCSTPPPSNAKGCNRRGSRGMKLRWLPPGADARVIWRAGNARPGLQL